MNGKVLATWMQKLRDEFVNRMSSIDADADAAAAASAVDESEEEESQTGTGTEVETEGAGTESMADVQERDRSTSETGETRPDVSSERAMEWSPERRFEMMGALQSETGGG